MLHDLKIKKQYFEEIIKGNKKFEVRKNDRNFKVGDYLCLYEYEGLNKTERSIEVKVFYILPGGSFGIDKEYYVLAIEIKCMKCGKDSNSKRLCE